MVEGNRVWEAWFALVVAHHRVMTALDREVEAECGFGLAFLEVLYQLSAASDRRLRMHELARACHTSKSGLTRLVDRIEAAGLAVRAAIPGDRRSFYVVMTEEGTRALERAVPVVSSGLEEHVGRHVRTAEMEPMLNALRRIGAGVLAIDRGACDENDDALELPGLESQAQLAQGEARARRAGRIERDQSET